MIKSLVFFLTKIDISTQKIHTQTQKKTQKKKIIINSSCSYGWGDDSMESNDGIEIMISGSAGWTIQQIEPFVKDDLQNPKMTKCKEMYAIQNNKVADNEIQLIKNISFNEEKNMNSENMKKQMQIFNERFGDKGESYDAKTGGKLGGILSEIFGNIMFNTNQQGYSLLEILQKIQPFIIVRGHNHFLKYRYSDPSLPVKIISGLPAGIIMKVGKPKDLTPVDLLLDIIVCQQNAADLRFFFSSVFWVLACVLFVIG